MNKYKICSKTIMDTSDPDITFDENGISNHWHSHFKKRETIIGKLDINSLLEKIKSSNKKYDCIIGVSGGVDSTYLAYYVKKMGLNPLAVHFDNGWNSELAVKNIENTLDILGIDLYTYVVDWEEFKDLQLSFLKASTPDGEIPTDHAIIAILYKIAKKNNIKYILDGSNTQTESILPLKWGYGYYDLKYIKNVQSLFGNKKLKSTPLISLPQLFYYTKILKIKRIPILNFIEYKKEDAMEILINKLDWKYYGGKHYESIYTRFFQSYILPKKFNIDKRRAHLSNLICSGEISREFALKEIKKETYPSDLMKRDKEFVLKKLGLSENEFLKIINDQPKSFMDYKNNFLFLERIKIINQFIKTYLKFSFY